MSSNAGRRCRYSPTCCSPRRAASSRSRRPISRSSSSRASQVDVQRNGEVTVPGRKLLDICRALPEGSEITMTLEGERTAATCRSAAASRSRRCLRENFRRSTRSTRSRRSRWPQKDFKYLLDKTHFSMAQQDVRYYLNGLLLETSAKMLRTVATDGHRLAMCEIELPDGGKAGQQVIIPRKGRARAAANPRRRVTRSSKLAIGSNHVRVQIGDVRFTSKLIDGRFPDYGRVIPTKPPRVVSARAGRSAACLAASGNPVE